jgi:hypothetical protein
MIMHAKHRWNHSWKGKTEVRGEILSQCQMATTNPIWILLASNTNLRGEKPKNNSLIYDTAIKIIPVLRHNKKAYGRVELNYNSTLS